MAVDVAGATTQRFPPTDARIELDFEGGAVAARARVVRERRPLLALTSQVGVPLGRAVQTGRARGRAGSGCAPSSDRSRCSGWDFNR